MVKIIELHYIKAIEPNSKDKTKTKSGRARNVRVMGCPIKRNIDANYKNARAKGGIK